MRTVYFVTEGPTDQIVLEGLVEEWLGEEEFVSRPIQPPTSDYVEDRDTNLSTGWKGVHAWCEGRRPRGPAGRDQALRLADCLIIHIDADVASDPVFRSPAHQGPCPPASEACDWVRDHVASCFGGSLPPPVVLCVPSKDLEAWVLCALHPDIADAHEPIECRAEPGALLVQRPPRLVRRKAGALRKEPGKYRDSLRQIIAGWPNCVSGDVPRCPEAVRFEAEAKHKLGV